MARYKVKRYSDYGYVSYYTVLKRKFVFWFVVKDFFKTAEEAIDYAKSLADIDEKKELEFVEIRH